MSNFVNSCVLCFALNWFLWCPYYESSCTYWHTDEVSIELTNYRSPFLVRLCCQVFSRKNKEFFLTGVHLFWNPLTGSAARFTWHPASRVYGLPLFCHFSSQTVWLCDTRTKRNETIFGSFGRVRFYLGVLLLSQLVVTCIHNVDWKELEQFTVVWWTVFSIHDFFCNQRGTWMMNLTKPLFCASCSVLEGMSLRTGHKKQPKVTPTNISGCTVFSVACCRRETTANRIIWVILST